MRTSGGVVCWVAVCACLVVQLAAAAEEQQRQIRLEDIERDTLSSAKERHEDFTDPYHAVHAFMVSASVATQVQQVPQQQQIPLGYAQLAELQQQQQQLFSPATLQQLAAAYQPQVAQHVPAAAAAQAPQLPGQQLLYVSPAQAQQLQLQAQRQLLGGAAGAGLPVSAFYQAQQQPAAAAVTALQYQPAAAIPGAALAGAAYPQQYLQQFAQAPVVNIPAQRAQYKLQQQLQQQAKPDYNALAQQQVQQHLKSAHVKSTAAPPAKQQQQSQSGFVPIQAPTLRHPGRGVSFSHYRQGA
ncbi:putative uncharacterized protein DDB_G0271606 [Schistocerca serialis cubense]|uniref:putative uncharacterized protein DDB_G0271606 n=1 Tax=Schistocerca serialis cubense TaxID=2023355 RepID=UPI00214F39B3|nr:putative uncharacterized protein DDB_G0271606 [Schistocerca serialis cubense]